MYMVTLQERSKIYIVIVRQTSLAPDLVTWFFGGWGWSTAWAGRQPQAPRGAYPLAMTPDLSLT